MIVVRISTPIVIEIGVISYQDVTLCITINPKTLVIVKMLSGMNKVHRIPPD